MPTLAIQLLGEFCLTFDGSPVTGFNSPRLQSLLAFLVLHREASQSRRHLAFLFWPDSPESQARNNFRQLLYEFRHSLPDSDRFLEFQGPALRWSPRAPFTLDVDEFTTFAGSAAAAYHDDRERSRAALERAVALYRGDLLPNCYDDWIAPERERLREEFTAALGHLIVLLDDARDYAAAIQHAQTLLRHDPIHEATYRRLMRLYALQGDRPSALRTYHTCTTVLERELGVKPGGETLQLYQDLLNLEAPPAPSAATPGPVGLVGRRSEWSRLQSAWETAARGQAQFVVVEGESGIGKTRLAEELVVRVSHSGVPTASARCYAAEGALAFAPVTTWLRARPLPALADVYLVQVARLLPELLIRRPDLRPAPLREEWQRQHLFESLARALLGGPQPLLLFLDDLQWCDRDTLAFMRYLLRFDPQARLLVASTLRPEESVHRPEIQALASALLQSNQFTSIELGPLTEPETISLANAVLGRSMDATLAQHVFRETEGNPLLIVEMTRALTSGGGALSPKVQAALGARLGQLSSSARHLADVAATIGREFSLAVLAKASDAGEDALVQGMDELWRCRIVREHGTQYDFAHGKLRELVASQTSAARSRWLHRRVAAALEAVHAADLDAVSAQIAMHYNEAGQSEPAIRYYERAALVARQLGSNQEAIEHYRRALALCAAGTSNDCVARLYEKLGDVSRWVGQYEQAREAYTSALAWVSSPIPCARLHCGIGNALRMQNRYVEALETFTQAARILNQPPREQSPEWWQEQIAIQLDIGSVHYWLGQVDEYDRSRQTLEQAVRQHGTPAQRAAYYDHVSSMEFRRDRSVATPQTIALTKAALAAYQEVGDPAQIAYAHFMVGFRVLWGRDPEEAIPSLETGLHQAEQLGYLTLQARCLTYLTVACRQCGQIDAARQYAARSAQVAIAAQMPEYVGTAKANQAWIAYREGDSFRTKELGRAAFAAWHELPPSHASLPFQWLALVPLIAVAFDERRLSAAVDDVRRLLDPAQQPMPDALAARFQATIREWDAGAPESSRLELRQALLLARQSRYL